MCSRGVWQLEKLTLQYCGWGGSSRGLRSFVRNDLAEFAKVNPQLRVEVTRRNNRHPVLVGEYKSGEPKVIGVKNLEASEIKKFVQELRDSSGRKMTKIQKFEKKPVPSIQGFWRQDGWAKKVPVTIKNL